MSLLSRIRENRMSALQTTGMGNDYVRLSYRFVVPGKVRYCEISDKVGWYHGSDNLSSLASMNLFAGDGRFFL